MFLSPVFCETLANISGATIELYNTDGAQGAARGAGIGAGIYKDFSEAFNGLDKVETITPSSYSEVVTAAYQEWLAALNKTI
jgi:xylulokinase